jgi:hypothetical protein
MTDALEPLVSRVQSGSAPNVKDARLLTHSRDKRAVVQYQVAGGGGVVIGKLYADANQSTRVYRNLTWLQGGVFAGSAQCGVPQPLAHLRELSMIVYLQVEGQFLDKVLASDHAMRSMELAGEWLATLHSHRSSIEKHLHLSTALDIHDCLTLISKSYPDHTEVVRQLAGYLEKGADALCFETNVPIHRDFHYRHIIVNDGLTVIDLDEMRLGDPNYDLAHFCANLDLLAYREHKSLAELQSRFLDNYTSYTNWVRDERFVYFYVYTCLKIAKQLCTMRGPYPRPDGAEQRRQVQMILGQGLATMRGQHVRQRLSASDRSHPATLSASPTDVHCEDQRSPYCAHHVAARVPHPAAHGHVPEQLLIEAQSDESDDNRDCSAEWRGRNRM